MNNYDKYNYEFIKCVNTTHQTLVNMLSSSWSGVTYTKQYSDSTKKLGITKKLDYNSAFEISTMQKYWDLIDISFRYSFDGRFFMGREGLLCIRCESPKALLTYRIV